MIAPAHVALGTPYTRVGASEGYIQSLANFMAAHPATPYKVQAGASYGKNRNVLVDWFLGLDVRWLLQLDDDIRFPANLVELLSAGAPDDARVIVGSVPLGYGQPSNVFLHPDALATQPVTANTNGRIARVVGFGGAIMLVHRSIYEAMATRYGHASWYAMWHDQMTVPGIDGTALRELEPDLSFGRRLSEMGVAAWARFGLPVTHSKPTELTCGEGGS